MKKKLPFRSWYYFRMGWATYFAFIIAGTNTMVVTYYLAIEEASFLKEILPSFTIYNNSDSNWSPITDSSRLHTLQKKLRIFFRG